MVDLILLGDLLLSVNGKKIRLLKKLDMFLKSYHKVNEDDFLSDDETKAVNEFINTLNRGIKIQKTIRS